MGSNSSVLSPFSVGSSFNPLYTGGLFHFYRLDESICYFRGVGLFCFLYSIFVDPTCNQFDVCACLHVLCVRPDFSRP